MFDPRPEISTATRFLIIASPRKIEAAAIDGSHAVLRRNDLAELHDGLAVRCKTFGGGLGADGIEHRNHADPAVESAQHFGLADRAARREPLEYWKHRHAREVYRDGKVIRQHAWDIFSKSAACDVSERLDRFGFANCGEA